MGHNKLTFDEVKDLRKVGSFPLRRYRFGREKVNKIVVWRTGKPFLDNLSKKPEKKQEKVENNDFFVFFG